MDPRQYHNSVEMQPPQVYTNDHGAPPPPAVYVSSYTVARHPQPQVQNHMAAATVVQMEPTSPDVHRTAGSSEAKRSGCSKTRVGCLVFWILAISISLGVGLGVGLSNVIVVTVQSANTKQDWMEAMALAFNNSNTFYEGRRIVIKVVHTGSNLSSTVEPDLWSPATDDWISQVNTDYGNRFGSPVVSNTSCPSSASIPLGIAMWRSMAELLGWPNQVSWNTIASLAQDTSGWARYNRPGLGTFKFGHGHPVYSNSGRLSVISMIHSFLNISTRQLNTADVSLPSVYNNSLGIQRRVFHYGKIDTDLLDRMTTRGKSYLHAVTNYESNIIRWNRLYANKLEEPLVLLYTTEGTFWNNHPLCIVDSAPWSSSGRSEAAKIFQQWLLAREQQAQAPLYGVRPADRSVNVNVSPFNQANGVVPNINSETVATLPLPQPSVVDRVIELWASVKTPAYIVLVIDTSGSMETDNRIAFARRGAATFIRQMYPQDLLRVLRFSSDRSELVNSAWGNNRAISVIRNDMLDMVSSLSASGATSLYDSVYAGWQLAQSELVLDNQQNRPRRNYGVIVMTDGDDTSSQRNLETLLSQLPNGEDSNQVHIWTIAYGRDATTTPLERIAAQTNGKFFRAATTDIEQIYFDISSEL